MDEAKLELVQSWLRKALHDLEAARVLGATEPPLLDMAMYHCQQAAEKALKGYLVYWDQRPEKTHSLGLLLDKVIPIEPLFDSWRDAANRLTPLATLYRYPGEGEEPSLEDFEEALDDATTIVKQALAFLPPEVSPGAVDT
jgi:HEPN domain-containing protein